MPIPLPPSAVQAVVPARRRFRFGFDGASRLILSRPLGIVALVGVVLGALILPPTGISIGTCGFHNSTGLPCVGCGLTRSVTCFLQGEFAWSMAYHPFGPAFAIAFVLMGAMAVLPEKWREAVLVRLSPFDRLLGILIVAFLTLLIVYGLYRISLVASGEPGLQWWKTGEAPPIVAQS